MKLLDPAAFQAKSKDATVKIINESGLFDKTYHELRKTRALVDPIAYINERIATTQAANQAIGTALDTYIHHLITKEKLPDLTVKQLANKRLLELYSDATTMQNLKYPIDSNNSAAGQIEDKVAAGNPLLRNKK